MVCTGQTGHAEVIQIEFDPAKVSFEKLLTVFWKAHDPTTLNMQGDDFGPQYRSIILYHSEEQKKTAEKSAHELRTKKVYKHAIVTQLVPFVAFYSAEAYHQNYYQNHRGNDYTQFYIEPKLRKLRLK
jgi:peptide-methionine (S)-S-oxide reductase